MVPSVQLVDFDTAVTTPEGRLALATEYFAAHRVFFIGADEARMTKIRNKCVEEIAQVARESLAEKPFKKLGIEILFPEPVQRAIIALKNSIPLCIQNAWTRAMNVLHIPMPSLVQNAFYLEERKKHKITVLAALVMVVFLYILTCTYL